jgi:hypothetical protein
METRDITKFDRITTILKPFSDLNNIPQRTLDIAGCRGAVTHKLIDSIILGLGTWMGDFLVEEYCDIFELSKEQTEKEKKKVENAIKSFEQWRPGKFFLPKPERFFDESLMICGEIDGLYQDRDRGIVLIDYKTSGQESRSWQLQGSAYSFLAKQAHYPIEVIQFIKLDKDKGNAPLIFTYQENFPLFKAHLDVYRYNYKEKPAGG